MTKRNYSRIITTIVCILVLFSLGCYYFFSHTLNYVLFAPNQYIAYNLADHQIEILNKYGTSELLWKDSNSLDVSNSIEVDEKLIFIVNYENKADLVVLDITSKNLVNQIPLAGAKGVSTEQLYLLGDSLYIKYRTVYMNSEEYSKAHNNYKKNEYELEYIVPIQALLNHQVNLINPVNVKDLEKATIGVHYSGGPKAIIDDLVFLENYSQDKECTLYENGNTKVNYIADGKIVRNETVIGPLKEGRYFLNNKEFLADGESFFDDSDIFRFRGIYSNEYVLFNGYEERMDLKHADKLVKADSLVYCLNNILVKKIFLPKSIFESYDILYTGK